MLTEQDKADIAAIIPILSRLMEKSQMGRTIKGFIKIVSKALLYMIDKGIKTLIKIKEFSEDACSIDLNDRHEPITVIHHINA